MKKTLLGIITPLLLLAACAASHAQESALAAALKASYEAEANGDYSAAIKALAIPNAAGAYIAQLRLGWLGYCAKDWTESITRYKQAAQLAPFAIEPLLGLMLPQQAAGKNDDAIHTAQTILRQDPNNYTALSRTAWLLYLRRDYKQAAITYRKLVNLYPTDTEMLLGLGFALKFAGERKEAAQYFNTVLLLSPNNSRALEGLREEPIRGNGNRPGPPPKGGPRPAPQR